ncbi:MAG: hypothetical protein KDA31_06500 [Phycisphaerales bacterium]|nr:hypothetical protein [Phycisphaerales bacterium]MCB9836478.1 hypothetical protein [Phycisphaera sp.]
MKKWVLIGIGAAAALLVVFAGYRSVYARPMAEMRETLKSWHKGKDQMQRSLGDATKVKTQLASIEATTLGPTGELAEHRLRSLLTDLCGQGGLQEFVIACREPKAVGNPAADENPVEFNREMRRQADFLAIETTVTGRGSLDACMHTVALLEAQPWLHRVSGVSIQPRGKERTEFDLSAQVVTIVMPDLATDATGETAQVVPVDQSQWAAVTSRNPFIAVPPPPEPVVEVAQQAPPAPPKPKPKPLDDWVVTGVMRTSGGGEAILSNRKTGESRVLLPGGEVMGMKVSSILVGEIVMMEGESGYRVALGRSLAEREPLIE